jgi:hypothetical protein
MALFVLIAHWQVKPGSVLKLEGRGLRGVMTHHGTATHQALVEELHFEHGSCCISWGLGLAACPVCLR